jgi:acyl-CoA thioester hydrolase
VSIPFYFDYRHTVAADEIDAQGHVHNLRYLAWTLKAASDHSAALGWDAAAGLERGLGWVVRSHEATYRQAALAGDRLVVRTWVNELARVASRRRYLICRPADRAVLARIETRWAFVDLRVRRAVAVPAEIASRIPISVAPPPLPWEEAADAGS